MKNRLPEWVINVFAIIILLIAGFFFGRLVESAALGGLWILN